MGCGALDGCIASDVGVSVSYGAILVGAMTSFNLKG